MATLYPSESQWFSQAKRKADQQWGYGRAQTKFDRDVAQQQYTWDRKDLLRNWADQRKGFAGTWAKGGRLNSGGYQSGLGQMKVDKADQLFRLGAAKGLRERQFDLTGEQLYKSHANTVFDIGDQKRALLATLRQTLDQNRGYGS